MHKERKKNANKKITDLEWEGSFECGSRFYLAGAGVRKIWKGNQQIFITLLRNLAQIKIGNLIQERKCLSQFLHWTVCIDFAGNEVYFNDYTLLLLSKSLKSIINICVTWHVECFGIVKVQVKNDMLKSFTDILHPSFLVARSLSTFL